MLFDHFNKIVWPSFAACDWSAVIELTLFALFHAVAIVMLDSHSLSPETTIKIYYKKGFYFPICMFTISLTGWISFSAIIFHDLRKSGVCAPLWMCVCACLFLCVRSCVYGCLCMYKVVWVYMFGCISMYVDVGYSQWTYINCTYDQRLPLS